MMRDMYHYHFDDEEEFLRLLEGYDMGKQAIIRGKSVSLKGLTCSSDDDGNVTISSPDNPASLRFSENEVLGLAESLNNLIEWKNTVP
jgi:hypothetical protein